MSLETELATMAGAVDPATATRIYSAAKAVKPFDRIMALVNAGRGNKLPVDQIAALRNARGKLSKETKATVSAAILGKAPVTAPEVATLPSLAAPIKSGPLCPACGSSAFTTAGCPTCGSKPGATAQRSAKPSLAKATTAAPALNLDVEQLATVRTEILKSEHRTLLGKEPTGLILAQMAHAAREWAAAQLPRIVAVP